MIALLLLAVLAQEAPPNTWVPLKPVVEQPADPEEKGHWMNVGWNKLVYDPEGRRVLFYDRWYDKPHGGYTIYGNCLFSFDPSSAKLTPLVVDHWRKEDTPSGGYRTVAGPRQAAEPTPCSRHVYHGFDYVSPLKSVFLTNGANQSAQGDDGRLGHDLTADTWRYDLGKQSWTRIESPKHPPNRLEDGMAWSPEIDSIVYAGHGKIWILNLGRGEWREAREKLPRYHMGMVVVHDAPRKRMLFAGGGDYDQWKTKAGGFNTLYAFDPKTESVTRLADCPTALCRAGLSHDTKRDLFLVVAAFKGEGIEQPSGLFVYDPAKDAWSRARVTGELPLEKGWMPLCYDSNLDRLVGMVRETFYTFRYDPER
ncbi:MAG TPA: hypothetical protein VEN81_08400 [Planctomycetota bacterium]|nr:hypothetical protein [Planctomycetota bacterium]